MDFLPGLGPILAFTLAAFVLTITPGPDMTLFLGRTLSDGRAAGIAAMLGASTGVLVHTTLAAFGLSALIAASPEAFAALRIGGAAYLAWLAFQAVRTGAALQLDAQSAGPRRPLAAHWLTGIGINLLNPKIILFFVTFLPTFVSAGDPHAAQKLFFFGVYFILLAVPMSIGMILAADRFALALKRRPRIMRGIDWLFASVFSAFAVSILLAGPETSMGWLGWALGSAVFAALTAIFGKIGVAGIPSDTATFLRTIVILVFAGAIVAVTGQWRSPAELPPRALLFLVLSGLASGASWLCYYRALQLGQAALIAAGVVLVAWR